MPIATVKSAASEEGAISGERLKYLRLWDIYGSLLTETQREFCELYYLCDLSLSEIAEEKGVTKQSVSDTLKKSREILEHYEEKLHVDEGNRAYDLAVSDMMTKVSRALAEFSQRHPEFAEEIGAIADMVCVGEAVSLSEEE